ncbi:MAG: TetR/AcrR family transcriptional regulator [Eubacteriales bacterium]|nr:TetR/AcrR family transcriptional regulator [Eubacteriales bacterium]
MEKRTTKQRILDEALDLFATHGYDGVTVAQIAHAVKIKTPSLYKHYKSKQDIFDAILEEIADRYKKRAESIKMDGLDAGKDTELFLNISKEQLEAMGTQLFLFFLHDEFTRKYRRMLTIEQFRNPTASRLYVAQYIDSPIHYQSTLFEAMMERNNMRRADARTAAMHFYSPMFLLLCLCDSSPEREEEALDFVRRHISQFTEIYITGE